MVWHSPKTAKNPFNARAWGASSDSRSAWTAVLRSSLSWMLGDL